MVLFYIFSKKKLKKSYIQSTCFRSPMSRGWEMVVWYCSEDSNSRGGDSNLWRFTLALRVWLPSMYIKHRRCTCIYILPFLSSCKSMLFIWHPAGPTQISSSLSILIFIPLSTYMFLRLGIWFVWYCPEDAIRRGGDSNLWRFILALSRLGYKAPAIRLCIRPTANCLLHPTNFLRGGWWNCPEWVFALCTVPTFGYGLYVAVKEQWWGCDILCYWLAFCWGLFCCSEQGTVSQVQQFTFAQYVFASLLF